MRKIFISFFFSTLLINYIACAVDCTKDELASGETCNKLTASENHICVEDGTTKPCKEEEACNLLKQDATVTSGDKCANHKVSKENYLCRQKTGSDTDCEEVKKTCALFTQDASITIGDKCAKYEVLQAKYLCRQKSGSNTDCEEVKSCSLLTPDSTVTSGDKCAKYEVFNSGYVCRASKDGTKCEEIKEVEEENGTNRFKFSLFIFIFFFLF